jgi:hypothetical protein
MGNLSLYVLTYLYLKETYHMFIYLHRANWHSSATLTEVFP